MKDEVIKLDLSEVESLAKKFKGAESVIHKKTRAFMHEATMFFEGKVIDDTPVGATQELRNSIFSEVYGSALNLEGVIGSGALHTEPVELGTKPHWPPRRPLIYWASRKLGLQGVELRRAVRSIQRKIAKRGTKGKKMFETALKDGRSTLSRKVDNLPAEIMKAIR